MPEYSFRCRKCGLELTVSHKFFEPHPTTCSCGGDLIHLFATQNIHYHGSGFYATDKKLDHALNVEAEEAWEETH